MPESDPFLNELAGLSESDGLATMLRRLAERLRDERRYHELFDARLMQARHAQDLPIILTRSLDDMAEPARTRMEQAYLEACREVGELLLAEGRVREAWLYLRPTGDKQRFVDALAAMPRDSENYEQIIQVALYDGVCPRIGFEFVLANYGTCNAVSLFDQQMHVLPRHDQQEVASLMVRHLHTELLGNVKADIAKREGTEPSSNVLAELLCDRPELFEHENYHVDTSHLASVVRFALGCDDPEVLRTALDLTEYGRRLDQKYQFSSHEPFADTFPAHALFYRALLGEGLPEAVEYFRAKARSEEDPAAAEVLIALLARCDRPREAFEAATEFLQPGAQLSGFAPSSLELAARAKCYERLIEVCRQRGDALGFAAALVERTRK